MMNRVETTISFLTEYFADWTDVAFDDLKPGTVSRIDGENYSGHGEQAIVPYFWQHSYN
jgi:hypothetical protein